VLAELDGWTQPEPLPLNSHNANVFFWLDLLTRVKHRRQRQRIYTAMGTLVGEPRLLGLWARQMVSWEGNKSDSDV
jgi:hypothetical protein